MKNKLWKVIAYLLCVPWIKSLVIKQAKKRPYEHLGGYMHRWWLVHENWPLPFSIRLHHIKRHDVDPYIHNHTSNWRTIILKGWYIEEDAFGNVRHRKTGFTGNKYAHELHRIDAISPGGVWTLFIIGPRRNDKWGFMVNDRMVHYKDFHSPNNRID